MLLLKSPLRFVQSANVGDEFLFLLKELPDDVVWLMSDASPQSFEGWSWSLDPRWFRSGPLVTLVGETEDPFTARAVLHKTGQEPPTYEHHRTYPECVVRYLPAVTSASVLHTAPTDFRLAGLHELAPMLVLLRDLMHSRDGCLRLISSLPVVERPRVILKHLQFSKASLWRRNQQLVAWNDPSIYFFPLCLHLPFKDQVSTLSVDPSALFFRISHLLAEKATSFLNDVRAYCSASPVVSLSPLSTQITLLDRQRFEPLVQRACAATSSRICSARQWRLEDVPPEQYPIIVKSALGAGPLVSHYLAVARSPEGVHSFRQHFQELFPQQDDSKWSYKPPRKHLMTAYQLVPHDPPVVYKAFLLGKSLLGNTSASLMSLDSSEAKDYYEVLVRKSLALVKSDLRLDVETSEFLPFATTLMKGGPQQPLRPLNEVLGSDHAMIAASFFKHMAAELQCSTFGVDLLVDTRTNGLVVVDVNFFPSYNNHPNLKRDLKRWVLEEGVGDLKSSPLLEDTPACRTSAADLSCHLREALDCLAGAFRTLGPRNVMVAFNGGKDATVVFHLFRACLAAHYVEVECQDQDVAELSVPAPGAVYFRYPDEFAEMITFAKEQTSEHGFLLTFQDNSVITGMTKVIHSHIVKYGVGSVVGTVLGTRMGDPNEGSLQFFEPSSPHFPSFFRINPIIKWTYGCVWKFLLQFNLVYANMYDQGYSSIGTQRNTETNPALTNPDGSFKPAYKLADWASERLSRGAEISVRDSDEGSPKAALTAGVLVVGDELLAGLRKDTNSSLAAVSLEGAGLDVQQITVAPDNVMVITREVLRMAAMSDVLIVGGGLGPTHDDMTMEALAAAYNDSLVASPAMSKVLAKRLGCSVDRLPSPHSKLTLLPSRARLIFETEDDVICVDTASDSEPPSDSWPLMRLYNTFALPGVPTLFKQQMHVVLKAIRALKDQLPSIVPAFFRRVLVQADETVVVNVCGVESMLGQMPRLSLGVYPVSRPDATDSGVDLHCALLVRGSEADVTSGVAAITRALERAQIGFTVDDKETLPDERE